MQAIVIHGKCMTAAGVRSMSSCPAYSSYTVGYALSTTHAAAHSTFATKKKVLKGDMRRVRISLSSVCQVQLTAQNSQNISCNYHHVLSAKTTVIRERYVAVYSTHAVTALVDGLQEHSQSVLTAAHAHTLQQHDWHYYDPATYKMKQ